MEPFNPYKQTMDIAYNERKKMYNQMQDKYGKGVEWDTLTKEDKGLMFTVIDCYEQHCRFHNEYEKTGIMQ